MSTMSTISYLTSRNVSVVEWAAMPFLFGALVFLASAVYNLYFHPLARVPGPLLARATSIPSWYHTYTGKRHVWLWQQFQIYGYRVRVSPDTVLFCDPDAYADIYGFKSNVRRSDFYTAWRRNVRDQTTINTVGVAEHAHKRKLLMTAFTDKSVRAATKFIIKHVDRWNELLVTGDSKEWSPAVDFARRAEMLEFDIMGDLSFGTSFGIKEPGNNPLKVIPHNIAEYMQFQYPIARSPFLKLLLWLKPRGLDELFHAITPSHVKDYFQFVHDSVTNRIKLYKEQVGVAEEDRRQDMFYFLCEATNPDTGRPAYDEDTLRAEANLLIIAGSDTSATSLSGIFWYLTGDPFRLEKLVSEIRTAFESADEIVHGPQLLACTYLRACIDEGMRMTPVTPSELAREVLPGGITIKGEHYPAGTIVGNAGWATSYDRAVYRDPEVFRPERWIVDEAAGNTQAEVSRIRANFHPFSSGPGNCVGKNLALTNIMLTLARTLHRLDVRRAPGSTLGQGTPERGWGASDGRQFQLTDAFIALRDGPELQFRKRVD